MYNNIGLATARGSGTNGYVQRNLSFIKQTKEKIVYKPVPREVLEKRLVKKANADLLLHDNKRKLELKCVEMKELMTDQGFAEEEIEEKVTLFRKMLLESLESKKVAQQTTFDEDMLGRPITKGTHQFSEAAQRKNETLKNAFGIDPDYQPGSSFTLIKKKDETEPKKPTEPNNEESLAATQENGFPPMPAPSHNPGSQWKPQNLAHVLGEGTKAPATSSDSESEDLKISKKKLKKMKKREKKKIKIITYSENLEAVRAAKESKHKRKKSVSISSDSDGSSSPSSSNTSSGSDGSDSTVDSELEREMDKKKKMKEEKKAKSIKKKKHKRDKREGHKHEHRRDKGENGHLSSTSIVSIATEPKHFETLNVSTQSDTDPDVQKRKHKRDGSNERKRKRSERVHEGRSHHKHHRENGGRRANKTNCHVEGKPRAEHYFDYEGENLENGSSRGMTKAVMLQNRTNTKEKNLTDTNNHKIRR